MTVKEISWVLYRFMTEILLGINFKEFSPNAWNYYTKRLNEAVSRHEVVYGRNVNVILSMEDPDMFQHDFVGLLEIMSKCELNPEQIPWHFILDGGMKSRNYLLTLFYGYQGMYTILDQYALDVSLQSHCHLMSCMGKDANQWSLLSASDYDLDLRDTLLLGNQAMNEDLAHMANVFLVGAPLDTLLRPLVLTWLPRLRKNIEQFDSLSSTQVMSQCGPDACPELSLLLELCWKYSARGIIVSDSTTGKLLQFTEKPSIPQLMGFCASDANISQNIMYTFVKQSLLVNAYHRFTQTLSKDSQKSLRHSHTFGVYETLFQAPGMSPQTWDKRWMAKYKANMNMSYDAFKADGMQIQRIAIDTMANANTHVLAFRSESHVRDLGEPMDYFQALLSHGFTMNIQNHVSQLNKAHLDVSNPDNLVLNHTVFTGPGKFQIRNEHARVLLSHSVLHAPEGSCMIIGTGKNMDHPIVLESCRLSISKICYGTFAVGATSLEQNVADQTMHVGLRVYDASQDNTVYGICTHDIMKPANRRDSNGERPLDMCKLVGGHNFYSALTHLDLLGNQHFVEELLIDIQKAECDGCMFSTPTSSPTLKLSDLKLQFKQIYGASPNSIACAPGRINGGGAHTDWSYKHVFAFAIDRETVVSTRVIRNMPKPYVAMFSTNDPEKDHPFYSYYMTKKPVQRLPHTHPHAWTNYIVGIIEELRHRHPAITFPSLEIMVSGNMIQGVGLSSSAALENAVARSTIEALDIPGYSDLDIAQLSNHVEIHFVGVHSGILDQGTSALASKEGLVFFYCDKESPKMVASVTAPFQQAGYLPVVIDTGTRRCLAASSNGTSSSAWFEQHLNEFNRRVCRYWLGNTLVRELPVSRKSIPKRMLVVQASRIHVTESVALQRRISQDQLDLLVTPESHEENFLSSPTLKPLPSSYQIEFVVGTHTIGETHIPCDVHCNKTVDAICTEYLNSVFGSKMTGIPSGNDLLLVLYRPWVFESTGTGAREVESHFHLVGWLDEEEVDHDDLAFAKYIGALESEYLVSTSVSLNMVEFMEREDARVRHLANLLNCVQKGDQIPETVTTALTLSLQEHGALMKQTNQPVRYEISQNLGKSLSTSPRDLSTLIGALGELSWRDKRDLFLGDSALHTLDDAYMCASLVNLYSGDGADMIGCVCPGAGWQGMAPVFLKGHIKPLLRLVYLLCGPSQTLLDRIQYYKSRKWETSWEELLAFEFQGLDKADTEGPIGQQCRHLLEMVNMPKTFVPYAHMSSHAENRIHIWCTTPSQGMRMLYRSESSF